MNNVIITGLPGSGKTTLIQRLAKDLVPWRPVGFYTAEMRQAGGRTGFELESLDGRRRVLAHVRLPGPDRVGKYGVDVAGFEAFLEALALHDCRGRLIVLDEIGRMECLSPKFVGMMKALLDSDVVLLATVALKGEGLINEVKRRSDVELFEISPDTRDHIYHEILGEVEKLLRTV